MRVEIDAVIRVRINDNTNYDKELTQDEIADINMNKLTKAIRDAGFDLDVVDVPYCEVYK